MYTASHRNTGNTSALPPIEVMGVFITRSSHFLISWNSVGFTTTSQLQVTRSESRSCKGMKTVSSLGTALSCGSFRGVVIQCHKLSGLNNRSLLSPGSGGYKFKVRASAELVPSEAVREGSVPSSPLASGRQGGLADSPWHPRAWRMSP